MLIYWLCESVDKPFQNHPKSWLQSRQHGSEDWLKASADGIHTRLVALPFIQLTFTGYIGSLCDFYSQSEFHTKFDCLKSDFVGLILQWIKIGGNSS